MALTTCEDCGKQVSTEAAACPNCGRPMSAAPAAAAGPSPPTPEATAAQSPPPIWPPQPAGAPQAAGPSPAANLKRNWFRRHPILTAILALIVLIIIVAAAAGGSSNKNQSANGNSSSPSQPSKSSPSKPSKPAMPQSEKDARAWINKLGADSNRVAANVRLVQLQVGIARRNPSVAAVDKLAQVAQQSHDNLDGIRDDFAYGDDSGSLGNAELSAFSAANDLKNSMGALVTYTGTPNAATLASFNTQYAKARAEWNYGVRTIWRLAKKKHPPTV